MHGSRRYEPGMLTDKYVGSATVHIKEDILDVGPARREAAADLAGVHSMARRLGSSLRGR